ncbi:MAG: 16S rRNA (guanine(527)-N(7))-methyltransferase RsmG [Elusimicrobia bacterium]|nr:16S rRNA (guanine(527)-N(7))-methyltransferase RsmG [Elusimicrobiota bacterium]
MAAAAQAWGIDLGPSEMGQLRLYVSEVQSFNRKTNITADGDQAAIVLRHVADGLACVPVLKALAPHPAPEVIDLGAGAGFIGIAVKIAWPQARVTLLEPRLRRFGFLSAAAATLGLKDIRLLRRRADPAPHAAHAFPEGAPGARPLGLPAQAAPRTPACCGDLVVARALAPVEDCLLAALPMLRPGGHLVVYQSTAPDPRSPALRRAMASAGASWEGNHRYRLPAQRADRFLAVFTRPPHGGASSGGAHAVSS